MVTPGTPDPGTPPSTAEDASKPIETDTPPPEEPPRPGTANFGFHYSSDAATNSNWDRLDALLATVIPPVGATEAEIGARQAPKPPSPA